MMKLSRLHNSSSLFCKGVPTVAGKGGAGLGTKHAPDCSAGGCREGGGGLSMFQLVLQGREGRVERGGGGRRGGQRGGD